ncbi:MAG: hypothetical protein JNK58_05975 [Phycisphaerae bacterium]|nr:hypothetical protein [Phycisphaerae bacterium]
MIPSGSNHPGRAILRWFYPELALCRTEAERSEASNRGRASSPGFSSAIVVPVVVFVLYMLVVPAVYLWARPRWLPMSSMALVMVPAVPAYLVSLMLAVREHQRRAVRRYLAERGITLCIPCGYDLRGLNAAADRCPECGAPTHDGLKSRIPTVQPEPPAQ